MTSAQRRPAPEPRQCLQGRAAGEAFGAVQGKQGADFGIRLPHALRWRQEHRLRPHLRLPRGDEEVRAPLPAGALRTRHQDREGQQAAAYVYIPTKLGGIME